MFSLNPQGLFTSNDLLVAWLPIWFELILLALLTWLFIVFVVIRIIRRFKKFPVPAFFGALLNAPHRKRIQPPSMIIDGLGLEPGMKVVELGSGPGTFTTDIARTILPEGIVYAVDIQEKMHNQLRKRMQKEGVENIVLILADAEGNIPIEEGFADAAFAVAVIPEIPDPVKALHEVRRFLKKGGLFAQGELVIDPDFPLRRTAKRWAEEAGFVFKNQLGNALRYVLVFENPS